MVCAGDASDRARGVPKYLDYDRRPMLERRQSLPMERFVRHADPRIVLIRRRSPGSDTKSGSIGCSGPERPCRNEIRFTGQPVRRGSSTAIADLSRQGLDAPLNPHARLSPARPARTAHTGRYCGTGFAVWGLERPFCGTATAATPSDSRRHLPTRGRGSLGGGVESGRA